MYVRELTSETTTLYDPTWVDVEREIHLLDARSQTLVVLAPRGGATDDRHMAIGGGARGFIVYMTEDNLVFWNLREADVESSDRKIAMARELESRGPASNRTEVTPMGWWKVHGTENTIGDGPLDALGRAVRSVVSEYQVAFGRRPTRTEWEALLVAALGAEESAGRVLDDGVVKSVRIAND